MLLLDNRLVSKLIKQMIINNIANKGFKIKCNVIQINPGKYEKIISEINNTKKINKIILVQFFLFNLIGIPIFNFLKIIKKIILRIQPSLQTKIVRTPIMIINNPKKMNVESNVKLFI